MSIAKTLHPPRISRFFVVSGETRNVRRVREREWGRWERTRREGREGEEIYKKGGGGGEGRISPCARLQAGSDNLPRSYDKSDSNRINWSGEAEIVWFGNKFCERKIFCVGGFSRQEEKKKKKKRRCNCMHRFSSVYMTHPRSMQMRRKYWSTSTANHPLPPGQNPKLSNKLSVSGSSKTFCGGAFKPRGCLGDSGLGRSSTTKLLRRRSIFRRSGTLALRDCLRGSSCCWTRNSQLRTKWKVSWPCSLCRFPRDDSNEHA